MSVTAPTYIYPPLDSNPGQLYANFTTYMQANIPGWLPYSGELDDWLARAFTSIESTLTELASDVTTQVFRWFGANLVNLPPFAAQPAQSTITITVQDTNGPYTIPAYTQMDFPDASGTAQGFETIADVVVANGVDSLAGVFVQAITAGSAGNGCSGSGDLDTTGITFITALTLDGATTLGLDAELDSAYLNRLTAQLTTLSLSPITNTDFTTLASSQDGVGRAITLSTFNPANWTASVTLVSGNPSVTTASTANMAVGCTVTGTDIPSNTFVISITDATHFVMSANATASASVTATFGGELNQPGYVTSWVVDPTGAPLSSPEMAVVEAAIQAMCLESVTYSVEAPTSNTMAVTVVGCCWPGTTPSAIEAAVQAAITNFLEPNVFGQNSNPAIVAGQTYGWVNDNKVRVVVLENVAMNVAGMHFVTSLTINGVAADASLNGIVPITEPGTITVTLTNG